MAARRKAGARSGSEGRALEKALAAKLAERWLARTVRMSDASLLIRSAMADAGAAAAELTRRLGADNSRVSRLLAGDQNLTIGTIAEARHAVGFKLELRAGPRSA